MSEHELPIAPAPVKAHPVSIAPAEATNAPGDTTAGTAADGAPTEASAAPGALGEDQVRLALRRVKDPELNLNILDLGLIYEIRITGADVAVDMSLTSPGCPSGPEIMTEAEQQLKALPGVGTVAMNLVWSPPWTPDRIEPRVRAYLGF
jgi:metal-sulfur cluster biosynthetic enzyme